MVWVERSLSGKCTFGLSLGPLLSTLARVLGCVVGAESVSTQNVLSVLGSMQKKSKPDCTLRSLWGDWWYRRVERSYF